MGLAKSPSVHNTDPTGRAPRRGAVGLGLLGSSRRSFVKPLLDALHSSLDGRDVRVDVDALGLREPLQRGQSIRKVHALDGTDAALAKRPGLLDPCEQIGGRHFKPGRQLEHGGQRWPALAALDPSDRRLMDARRPSKLLLGESALPPNARDICRESGAWGI
jgi:hypothetical protein